MDQTTIYLIIFIGVSLALLFLAIAAAYLRLLSKYHELKEGKDANLDPVKILANARAKSQKMLEEAQLKSQEIIQSSQKFLANQEGVLVREIENVNKIYAKTYEDSLKNIRESSLSLLQNVPNEIKTFMVFAIDDFRTTLVSQVTKVQAQNAEALQEAYKIAQADVEKYKEGRMRQIDGSAAELVAQVTRKVIGKEITLDEHEKLVMKALEEAKRQNII